MSKNRITIYNILKVKKKSKINKIVVLILHRSGEIHSRPQKTTTHIIKNVLLPSCRENQ